MTAAYNGGMNGINPIMNSSNPAIRIASRLSNFIRTRPARIDKNVPEPGANWLPHTKVAGLLGRTGLD